MAGPAAEELVCGPISDGGDGEDIAMARRCLLRRFTKLEVAREMVRMGEAARRLVRTPWAEVRVRAIADALVERGTLTAEEIYELSSS